MSGATAPGFPPGCGRSLLGRPTRGTVQEALSGVIQEGSAALPQEEQMVLLKLNRLAHGVPAKVAGIRALFRQLGLDACPITQHECDDGKCPLYPWYPHRCRPPFGDKEPLVGLADHSRDIPTAPASLKLPITRYP